MKYKCPLCETTLLLEKGTSVDPRDGVTLYCPSQKCPAQEVFGHAINAEKAFEIIKAKYWIRRY